MHKQELFAIVLSMSIGLFCKDRSGLRLSRVSHSQWSILGQLCTTPSEILALLRMLHNPGHLWDLPQHAPSCQALE